MNRNSNSYTLIYAAIMVTIVAVALAFTSQVLKKPQQNNERIDKMKQILSSVAITPATSEVVSKYTEVVKQELLVNAQGDVVETFEGDKVANNEAFSMNTANAFKSYRKNDSNATFPVYVIDVDGQQKYIFPVNGAGLWGPIWGFVALEADGNTISGVNFSHAGETPGLGAEITTSKFSGQFVGKEIYKDDAFKSVAVVKAGKKTPGQDAVDGISGGTLTSNGVHEMMYTCMKAYDAYITKVINKQ